MDNRPVIFIGNGCKDNQFLVRYLCSLGVPVCTTWMSADLVPEDSPVFVGRPGVFGQRAGNIIIQKSTELYCFGTKLDGEQVAFNLDNFAPKARKYLYDADLAELEKVPDSWNLHLVDLSLQCNEYSPIAKLEIESNPSWLLWCKELYKRFRPELDGDVYMSPMSFILDLSNRCTKDDTLALTSSGGAALSFLQCFKFKQGQILTLCSSIGAMGMDIPMAIGACLGNYNRRTICVTGDGGFMLNIQELEVVRRLNLPIKFFVYCNDGYGSIRTMQDVRFEGRHVGCDTESGLTLPDLRGIADAFGIAFFEMYGEDNKHKNEWIWSMMDNDGPTIFQINVDPNYKQYPRVMSSLGEDGKWHPDSFENLTPKLPEGELEEIMNW